MNVDNGFGAACAALRVLAAATALAAGTGPVARLE
jgi:NCAIR mutase (PurE)-related protein